jgi:hypothetical protein
MEGRMNLTKADKQALQRLLSASEAMSNVAYNLGQKQGDDAKLCKINCERFDLARSSKLTTLHLNLHDKFSSWSEHQYNRALSRLNLFQLVLVHTFTISWL